MISVPALRWLSFGAAALVAGHLSGLALHAWLDVRRDVGVLRQFDLNAEANLAAWYYSFLLLCAAVLTYALAVAARLRLRPLAGRWAVLAVALLLMAVDETAQLHDMATGPIRRALDLGHGAFYYAWLLPALVVLVAGILYFLPLVRSLGRPARLGLVVAGGLYFGGAVGWEMVSGFALSAGRGSFAYQAVITVEECFELAGLLVLLGTLLGLAREGQVSLVMRFAGAGASTDLVVEGGRERP